MDTEIIKRGEIYWINRNPYREAVGHVQRAERPGIIVSNDNINQGGYTHEIVYLTTAPKTDRNTHVTIRSANKPSTALCEQVQTISNEQLGSYIGTCTKEEMEAVDRCLMTSLNLEITTTPETTINDNQADLESAEAALYSANQDLQRELFEAKTETRVYKQLYEELLQKTLNLTAPK